MIANGQTVRVVRGKKSLGTTGRVFWTGMGKYGPRLGVTDGNGATHWVDAANVALLTDAADVAAAHRPDEPPAGLFEEAFEEDAGNAAERRMVEREIADTEAAERRAAAAQAPAVAPTARPTVTVDRTAFDALVARVTFLEQVLAARLTPAAEEAR